jgi:hypothetical protein
MITSFLPGEQALWNGEPGRGIVFQPRDLFLVPFSMIWAAFAIFFLISVPKSAPNQPPVFNLFPLLIVGLAAYFVIGRFLVDAWIRSGIHYAVTNRRIIIERGGMFARQTVINLADLPPTSLRGGASGPGTIRFGESYNMWSRGGYGAWSPALDPTPQFIAIDDARRVFDLINSARDQLLREGRLQ